MIWSRRFQRKICRVCNHDQAHTQRHCACVNLDGKLRDFKLTYVVHSMHCIVSDLLRWRSISYRLMRSLAVIVMYELRTTAANAWSTAHPRVMEAVDPHFERLKTFFDQVSVCILTLTVKSQSIKDSLIAEAINEKHGLGSDSHNFWIDRKRSIHDYAKLIRSA